VKWGALGAVRAEASPIVISGVTKAE